MSYILSILFMAWSIYEKSVGNVLDTGLLAVASAIFWMAGNYFYKNNSTFNKEREDNQNE